MGRSGCISRCQLIENPSGRGSREVRRGGKADGYWKGWVSLCLFILYMVFSFFPGGLEHRSHLMHGDISYVHIYGIVSFLKLLSLSHVREYFKMAPIWDTMFWVAVFEDCQLLYFWFYCIDFHITRILQVPSWYRIAVVLSTAFKGGDLILYICF